MDNFKTIYKILKTLDKNKGNEKFDNYLISAERLGIKFDEWEQLLIELQENGYIRGLPIAQAMSDTFPHIVESVSVRITLKGMEYLENNGILAKAKEALKMVGEII